MGIKENPFELEISLYIKHKNKLFQSPNGDKISHSKIMLDYEVLKKHHNVLLKQNFQMKNYFTINPIKLLANLNNKTNLQEISTLISYIPDDEIKYAKLERPNNYKSLTRWLKKRTNLYNLWYEGFLNIRGEFNLVATQLWKRRFVRWCGYSFSVYNEYTGKYLGEIDIFQANKFICEGNSLENCVRIEFLKGCVEFNFDSQEKFEKAVDILSEILDDTK